MTRQEVIERSFRTWQGRLPQELRIRELETLEAANEFLQSEYIKEFNGRFTVQPEEQGTAFVPCVRNDLDRVFSIQTERIVNRDNTVKFKNKWLQIDKQAWRGSMAGCRVIVYQHFDETISLGFGVHTLGRYNSEGEALKAERTTPADKKKAAVLTAQPKHQTGHLMC